MAASNARRMAAVRIEAKLWRATVTAEHGTFIILRIVAAPLPIVTAAIAAALAGYADNVTSVEIELGPT